MAKGLLGFRKGFVFLPGYLVGERHMTSHPYVTSWDETHCEYNLNYKLLQIIKLNWKYFPLTGQGGWATVRDWAVPAERLRLELLLVHIERRQPTWLGYSICFGSLLDTSLQRSSASKTHWSDNISWLAWEQLGIPGRAQGSVQREESLAFSPQTAAPGPW